MPKPPLTLPEDKRPPIDFFETRIAPNLNLSLPATLDPEFENDARQHLDRHYDRIRIFLSRPLP